MLPSFRRIARPVLSTQGPSRYPHFTALLGNVQDLPPTLTIRSYHDPRPPFQPRIKAEKKKLIEKFLRKGPSLSMVELQEMIKKDDKDEDWVEYGPSTKKLSVARSAGGERTHGRSKPVAIDRLRGSRSSFNRDRSSHASTITNHNRTVTPFGLSRQIKIWLRKHPSPLPKKDIDELLSLVQDAPKQSVNAPVWNQVLAVLGREKKYTVMWKAFNDMKRRGIKPTTRTYTVLLNAYAEFGGVRTALMNQKDMFIPNSRPEPLTLSRVANIYNQSQQHISTVLKASRLSGVDPKLEGAETGLAVSQSQSSDTSSVTKSLEDKESTTDTEEINNFPTRAYIRFLGRFGLWDEMQAILVAMDRTGPLAPDAAIFTTMIHTLNNIDKYHRSSACFVSVTSSTTSESTTTPSKSTPPVVLPKVALGPTARALWDQAVRQCEIDPELALAVLQTFSVARPEDQRLAESLIPVLFPLTPADKPRVASVSFSTSSSQTLDTSLPLHMRDLPRLPLSIKTATQLMSILNRSRNISLAAHYTLQIIDDPKLRPDLDLVALRIAIHNLSRAHDVATILRLMETYNAPWQIDVYHRGLSAARWAVDWESALLLFRRMSQLPEGVEDGVDGGQPYVYQPPTRRQHTEAAGTSDEKNDPNLDLRGVPWFKGKPIEPDVLAIGELIRTALATKSIRIIRQSLAVFEYYPTKQWYTFPVTVDASIMNQDLDLVKDDSAQIRLSKASKEEVRKRVELAKDVRVAVEKVLEIPRSQLERSRLEAIRLTAKRVIDVWG